MRGGFICELDGGMRGVNVVNELLKVVLVSRPNTEYVVYVTFPYDRLGVVVL